MSLNATQFRKLAIIAAQRADEKSAESISLIDLRKSHSGISDYALVLTGTSSVHLKTLKDAIEETLDALHLHPLHSDGVRGSDWVVMDYGGLMIHIFHAASRAFYQLERQWENTVEVDWRKEERARKIPARSARPATKRKKSSPAETKKKKTLPARRKK